MTSPFKYVFSTICEHNCANSSGYPNRFGNWTWLSREARNGFGKGFVIGVSKRPGQIVQIRIPHGPRSRAIGKVIPQTPAFEAEYAACPICPSMAATEATFIMTPRSPLSSGVFPLATFAKQFQFKGENRIFMLYRQAAKR